MDHLTADLIALGHMRGRENAVQRVDQKWMATPYQVAYEQRQFDLRGDRFPFDFTAPSLQKRLLDYFETALGLTNAAELLQTAERDRQMLRNLIWEPTFTGLHSSNKELRSLVEGFTEFELFALNEVVVSTDPNRALMDLEVIEIATRKLVQGNGSNFITYVSRRLKLQCKKKHAEAVNLADLVIVRMWTDPDHPLWMTPSAGASRFINRITEQRLTNECFNRLAAVRKFQRFPSGYLDRFFSVHLVDPAGLKLREEFAETCEFSVDDVRRGRRKRSLKKETI